jgi:hypothetical protein
MTDSSSGGQAGKRFVEERDGVQVVGAGYVVQADVVAAAPLPREVDPGRGREQDTAAL